MTYSDFDSLRRCFNDVLQQARESEQRCQLFQKMELKLLNKAFLPELCVVLVNDYSIAFNLDVVYLVLIDSGKQLSRILAAGESDELSCPGMTEKVLLVNNFTELNEPNSLSKIPIPGPCQDDEHQQFFKSMQDQVVRNMAFVATLTMYRHGLLLGFLTMGSIDQNRDIKSMATDFLERLVMLGAVSIENAVNLEYLRQLGLTALLTFVGNRRFFCQRLKEAARVQRHDSAVACLNLGIDHLNHMNDKFGHVAGDVVRVHVTKIIHSNIRSSNTLARIDGEEFVVILPEISEKDITDTAERIRAQIEDTLCGSTTERAMSATVSIGITMIDSAKTVGEPAEALVNIVDKVLYDTKASGRHCISAKNTI